MTDARVGQLGHQGASTDFCGGVSSPFEVTWKEGKIEVKREMKEWCGAVEV
jgi:hypothetical protein